MEVKAVAAKLGLGTSKIRGSSGFWRCMRTSTMNAAKERERGTKSRERSIFLCFTESNFCGLEEYTSQVIRPIGIQSDIIDGNGKREKLLKEAAYKTTKGNLKHFPFAKYGSDIIFPYGPANHATSICRIDTTSTRSLRFSSQKTIKNDDHWQSKGCPSHKQGQYLACFREGRHDAVLGAVQGFLYCFSNDNRFRYNDTSPNFMSLNPGTPFLWRTVNNPPFLRGKLSPNYTVAFLNESKRILGWELGKPGVFAFDIDRPADYGWKKLSLPLEKYSKPFIVHGSNRDIGDFHVMFTYEPDTDPLLVSAFFISKNLDHFQPLTRKSIKLSKFSKLCSEYLLSPNDNKVESDAKHMAPTVSSDFQFIDLGRKGVGLVLHKYFEDDPKQGRNTGIILVLGFRYDIITGVNNTLEIRTEFLEPRRFRYRTKQLHRKTYNTETCCEFHKDHFDKNDRRDVYTQTRQVHLDAAFLI